MGNCSSLKVLTLREFSIECSLHLNTLDAVSEDMPENN